MRSICCVCCGDLNKEPLWRLHSLRSCAPRLPREYNLWHTKKATTDSKVLTLQVIDRFFTLDVHIPITFPSENYCSVCIVIQKTLLDLADGTVALVFMAGCSYWLCNALWSDQTRRDKPLSKHSWEHRCWSTRVIYRGCRDVDSNS